MHLDDEDRTVDQDQQQPMPQRPRIAPADVLFDMRRKRTCHDAVDVLTELTEQNGTYC